MKFLLKISLFLALIFISKVSEESEEAALTNPAPQPAVTTLSTYQQEDRLNELEEVVEVKKVKTVGIY